MFQQDTVRCFQAMETPFYYYDTQLLSQTLSLVAQLARQYDFKVHYALKANNNDPILKMISQAGFGADCVSGNEVEKAIACGFPAHDVVFAGVGKSDKEILQALRHNIFCFNCESVQELEVINQLAAAEGKIAQVALRLNPNVAANTHKYITTGLEENKFGINLQDLDQVTERIATLSAIRLTGIHFHIGSQICDLDNFRALCQRVNEISEYFSNKKLPITEINVGGGLGISYQEPDQYPIADFESYFAIFHQELRRRTDQRVHFEIGRAIVAQCGSLISRVLYIKHGTNRKFAILDAGMTELIRPALYQAFHKIENLSLLGMPTTERYDVVGPICESSDSFGKDVPLPLTERGHLIAIRSAGAYGEVMTSAYNLREKAGACYSHELLKAIH